MLTELVCRGIGKDLAQLLCAELSAELVLAKVDDSPFGQEALKMFHQLWKQGQI